MKNITKRFKLRVTDVYEWGSETYYHFRNYDEPDSDDPFQYRGNALNLREGGKVLEIGDVIELHARYKTTRAYNMIKKKPVKQTWISHPQNKKLISVSLQ